MRLWMGTDVASKGGFIWGKNFQKIIGGTVEDCRDVHTATKLTPIDNIKRRIAIDTNKSPKSTYLLHSCPGPTDSQCASGQIAYTVNSNGIFWVSKHSRANISSTNRRKNGRQITSKVRVQRFSYTPKLLFQHQFLS